MKGARRRYSKLLNGLSIDKGQDPDNSKQNKRCGFIRRDHDNINANKNAIVLKKQQMSTIKLPMVLLEQSNRSRHKLQYNTRFKLKSLNSH
jgi:hypothetical protein